MCVKKSNVWKFKLRELCFPNYQKLTPSSSKADSLQNNDRKVVYTFEAPCDLCGLRQLSLDSADKAR